MQAWGVVVVLLAACGGRVAGGEDGGSSPGASSSGGQGAQGSSGAAGDFDAADFPICPGLEPPPGSACAMPRTQGCRYMGIGRTQQCTTCADYVCVDGKWQMSTCSC